MEFTINATGEVYFQKRKRDLLKFLFTFPIFITVVSVLFILGTKSKSHLCFSIFLLVVLASFIIFIIVSIFQKINRTVSEVVVDVVSIEFKTFKIFILDSKKYKIDKRQIKLIPEKFQINKKEIEEGWKIQPINKNHYIYFIKSFFDAGIIDQLKIL
jgi:hypothetical protein